MQANFLYFYDVTERSGALGGERGYKAIETVGRYPAPGGAFPAPKAPTDWIRGHAHSIYSFFNALHEGRQPSPDFDSGAHVQAVMEAAYASAESGRSEQV
jgi:predicted dehydrogenase